MSSAAQAVANIENARHSTGPRTEEGKASSSQNAIKHGLTCNKSLLLPDEDEDEFREFSERLKYDDAPGNCVERAAALEARIVLAGNPDFKGCKK